MSTSTSTLPSASTVENQIYATKATLFDKFCSRSKWLGRKVVYIILYIPSSIIGLIASVMRKMLNCLILPGGIESQRKKLILFSEILGCNPIENLNGEKLKVTTSDGVELSAAYFNNTIEKDNTGDTIILCNGNYMIFNQYEEIIKYLQGKGFNVVAFDYRGYGNSENKKRGAANAITIDTEAVLNSIKEKYKIDNDKITILGSSIGGFAATQVASRNKGVNLIINQSGSTLGKVAYDMTGRIPIISHIAQLTVSSLYGFNSVKAIKKVSGSICIIRSEDDNIMKEKYSHHAEKLFNAAFPKDKEKKETNFIELEGEHMSSPLYNEKFENFLKTLSTKLKEGDKIALEAKRDEEEKELVNEISKLLK